jgi:ABC-2 type transport system ATP-binding protein
VSAVLEVQGVTRSFGDLVAVDHVSFDVAAGSIVGFIGPNGAGKTTTMRICATLDLPDTGDVRVGGYSVLEEPREARRAMGFMPDAYGGYPNTTIAEYLDFYARSYGLKGKTRRDTIADVVDFTALDKLMQKEMRALSKGMRQRLCLAKTMLHDPSVLILDEPAAGLDPRARVELRELLKALAETGKGVLISSHILSELSEMCDGVVVIESGHIRAHGTVASVTKGLSQHTSIFVRTLSTADRTESAILEVPGVVATRRARGGVVVDLEDGEEAQAHLLEVLVERGLRPIEFAPEYLDLEDVFLSVTEGLLQ